MNEKMKKPITGNKIPVSVAMATKGSLHIQKQSASELQCQKTISRRSQPPSDVVGPPEELSVG